MVNRSQYFLHLNFGGQFTAKNGGQFVAKSGGHIQTKKSGHFTRNLHYGQETDQQKIDRLTKELEEAKVILENKNRELTEGINSKDAELKAKAEQVESKNKLIEQTQTIVTQMQAIINNNAITAAEKDAQLKIKQTEIDALNKQVGGKDVIIETKDKNINAFEKSISDLRGTIIDKQTIVDEKESKISTLNHTIAEQQRQLTDLKSNRRWLRVVQGVGIYKFRTPEYELAPQSSQNPNVLVINNRNSGTSEADFLTGLAIMAFDFDKKDIEQRGSTGPFIGFGGKDLFKNFYLGWDLKYYMIHINAGFNFHEFNVLKSGFSEGDVVAPGQTIPTNREWKTFIPYIGISIDTEFLVSALGKIK